jgi:hypothetical protein
VYLLKFEYEVGSNRIAIKSTITNNIIHKEPMFSTPLAEPSLIAWVYDIPVAPLKTNPSIIVDSTLSPLIGFNVGTYPATSDSASDVVLFGTSTPKIQPKYVPIYYKPNNSQFGVQGAVSSGDLINRKKYDTITSVGASFRSAYGAQTANALAYGSSMYGYTLKDRIGYPTKKTPTFSKNSDKMITCELTKISNAI